MSDLTPNPDLGDNTSTNGRQKLYIDRKHFGQLLQECRLRQEMTIAQAAESAHLKRDTVLRLENGDLGALQLQPYYAKAAIEKLCAVYNTSAEPIIEVYEMDAMGYQEQFGGQTDPLGQFSENDEETDSTAAQHKIAQTLIITVFVSMLLLVLVSRIYMEYKSRHRQPQPDLKITELLPLEPPPMEELAIP